MSICSPVMLTGGTHFYITDYVSIQTLWLWISNQRKRNQARGNSYSSQSEQNEYNDIYQYVQEMLESKHVNQWKFPLWYSKTAFLEWEDLLLNTMENYNIQRDKHTPIVYLIREDNAPMSDADLLTGSSRIYNQIIQVPLKGLAHQEDIKELYAKLFEATNSIIAGLCAHQFTIRKDGSKALFAVWQKCLGEDAVNRDNDKACYAMQLY